MTFPAVSGIIRATESVWEVPLLKKIYDAVDRFCARHPRFGIPNLMRYIVIGTAAVYILMVLTRNNDANALSFLSFNLNGLLHGEIWRIVTFIFVPGDMRPFWLIVVCVGKAVLCGLCAGLAAKALEKKQTLSCIAAALVAPVVNTGVFAVGMLTVFRPILAQYAGGTDVVTYLFVAFIGVNFLVEFAVNAVLSAAIARIVQVVRKQLEK